MHLMACQFCAMATLGHPAAPMECLVPYAIDSAKECRVRWINAGVDYTYDHAATV
jgi:hypothetical protein